MNGDPEKNSESGGGTEEEGLTLVFGESGVVYKNRKVPDQNLGTRDHLVAEAPVPQPYEE